MDSYRGQLLSLSDALEELIAHGRSEQRAGSELQSAIENGAITFLDPHRPSPQEEQVAAWAIQVIRAFINRTRAHTTLMIGVPEYVAAIRIARVQFEAVFKLPSGASKAQRAKRGRRPEFHWDLIQSETLSLMNHHGDFDPVDPAWNAQARLEEALKTFCQQKWQREPSTAALRERLPRWLAEWRANKRGGV